jgi:hypothetical protein
MPPFDFKTFLSTVGAGKNRTTMRTREVVFFQGDPADGVFYIEDGKIELKVVSPHGKEAVLAILGVGEFVGEGALAGQPLRMATANSSRKAPGAASLAVGQCRKRREAGAGYSQGQPGEVGRDDRHYPVARKFLHEQIPQARLHRVQRRPERQPLAADRGLARLKDESFLSSSSCPRYDFADREQF